MRGYSREWPDRIEKCRFTTWDRSSWSWSWKLENHELYQQQQAEVNTDIQENCRDTRSNLAPGKSTNVRGRGKQRYICRNAERLGRMVRESKSRFGGEEKRTSDVSIGASRPSCRGPVQPEQKTRPGNRGGGQASTWTFLLWGRPHNRSTALRGGRRQDGALRRPLPLYQ